MPKLIFRGTTIRFVDLRYDEESKATFTKINFSAELSKPVMETMEWGEPPSGYASAKLDGSLVASNLILTPNGKELQQHELQISAQEIGSFAVYRVKDGESTKLELRFQVVSQTDGAAALLEQYIRAIGKGQAQLRVNYAQQAEMDLHAEAAAEAEDAEEPLIREEQARDTSEDADEEFGQPKGASLASAVLVGGTHQRATRAKRGGRPVN